METRDFRTNKVVVYGANGEVIKTYEGKIYIYFGEKGETCLHFVTEDGKHHRVYNAVAIIDEM